MSSHVSSRRHGHMLGSCRRAAATSTEQGCSGEGGLTRRDTCMDTPASRQHGYGAAEYRSDVSKAHMASKPQWHCRAWHAIPRNAAVPMEAVTQRQPERQWWGLEMGAAAAGGPLNWTVVHRSKYASLTNVLLLLCISKQICDLQVLAVLAQQRTSSGGIV